MRIYQITRSTAQLSAINVVCEAIFLGTILENSSQNPTGNTIFSYRMSIIDMIKNTDFHRKIGHRELRNHLIKILVHDRKS